MSPGIPKTKNGFLLILVKKGLLILRASYRPWRAASL